MEKNQKLHDIIEMPTLKLMRYLNSAIRKKYYDIYTDDDNYIFAVPKQASNHIMLVSHMDTVKRSSKVKLIDNNGVITNANGVLGADDRAGVFAILEIANRCIKNKGPLPYLLFTNYEECGGLGVRRFCKDKIDVNVIPDIYLMIELDRRGINDAVYYSEPEAALKPIIESVGYKEAWGSYSDVSTLSDFNDIAHVNLSIGYFNEHTKNEMLVSQIVWYAIDNVMTLMPLITRQYNIDPDAWGKKWSTWHGGSYGRTTGKYGTTYTHGAAATGYPTVTVYDTNGKKKEVEGLALPSGETGKSWKKDKNGEWYRTLTKTCPNCMSWENVEEYIGLGTNKCWECGIYFDNEYNILDGDQSDEAVIQYIMDGISEKEE